MNRLSNTTANHTSAGRRRTRASLLALLLMAASLSPGAKAMPALLTEADLSGYLDQIAGSDVPGLQYMVVDADQTLFEYAGGWADIQANRPMTPGTTLMAYSMTKTFTAVAVLQLVEQGRLGLADELDRHVPDTPYTGRGLTIRQLLAHTAGIPNPIPLRWVHLSEADAVFDEAAALAQVLQDNPKLASEPGERFAYTNSGYWLLGSEASLGLSCST